MLWRLWFGQGSISYTARRTLPRYLKGEMRRSGQFMQMHHAAAMVHVISMCDTQ